MFAGFTLIVGFILEKQSPRFVLSFAVGFAVAAVVAALQGAWTFAIVEVAWSGMAVQRWWQTVGSTNRPP
jgi:hypothetical protein